jgi:glyoxylase-like metal-dependent hydrolase (beta-lactamase superfamily II)
MNNLELKQLTQHVYWSMPEEVTDRPVLGAVVGSNGTLMVEAAASPLHARQFYEVLQSASITLPKFAVLTHWHWDHVFGSSALEIPLIAHMETAAQIQQMARLDWRDIALDRRVEEGSEIAFIRDHIVVELSNIERSKIKLRQPEIQFSHQMQIYLGEVTACMIHVGGVHSPDSCVVFIPEERVVFLGDCLYENLYSAEQNTPANMLPLRERLLELEADVYLPAHKAEPMLRAELEEETRLMRAQL